MKNRKTGRLLTAFWVTCCLGMTRIAWAIEVDLISLAAENRAAVVNVSTTFITKRKDSQRIPPQLDEDSPLYDFFRRYFKENPDGRDIPEDMPREYKRQGGGSGFIVSKDGYIITNAHVVRNADEVSVALTDRREFVADVVGTDTQSDVALLKIEADKPLPTVRLGNSDTVQVGQWVLAIGSPFGFEYSATQGIVSALGRSLPDETYVPFIQTDVAVNPGNSGGPLFNMEGEVIGVNSQIYSRTGGYMGLSFAIPINLAMHVKEQLQAKGYVSRGWLGVLIQEVNYDLAQSFGLEKPVGALIAQVLDDSPAQAAQLEVGDIILKYNGKPVNVFHDLPNLVGLTAPNEHAELLVLRQGDEIKVTVTVGELPDETQEHSKHTAAAPKRNPLKLSVTDLSETEREELNVSHGVRVSTLKSGPAALAGIRAGDIILQLNRMDVKDVAHFNELVAGLPTEKPVPVLIQRQSGAFFTTVEIPEEE
jgi:serine protease Do